MQVLSLSVNLYFLLIYKCRRNLQRRELFTTQIRQRTEDRVTHLHQDKKYLLKLYSRSIRKKDSFIFMCAFRLVILNSVYVWLVFFIIFKIQNLNTRLWIDPVLFNTSLLRSPHTLLRPAGSYYSFQYYLTIKKLY